MPRLRRHRRQVYPCALLLAALCVLASQGTAAAQFTSPTDEQYQPFLAPPKAKPPPDPPDIAATTSAPVAELPPEPNPARSSLSAALRAPGDVELTAESVSEGGLLALLLVALLYLPVMIFNKTTERNHEVISGWLAGPLGWLSGLGSLLPFAAHPLLLLLSTGVVSAFLFSWVEPGFPTEEGSLQYLLGMMLGFSFIALVFFTTWREVVHRLEPESRGRWRLYPPFIILAALLVLFARLAHFLPGVVLGTLAEYEPGKELSRRTAGLRVFVTYAALLAVGAAAWFAWIPVEHAASEEGASNLTLILDSALAVTFVTGLESVVFGLIPLKFLDGDELFVWHKGLWLLLWGTALFWFSEVIVHPTLSTYHEISSAGAFWFGVLFAGLMIVAVGTWAYFRARDARLEPAAVPPEDPWKLG